MIVDLIIKILADDGFIAMRSACADGVIHTSSYSETYGRYQRLIFIVDGALVYAILAGVEYTLCVDDPQADLESWILGLRNRKKVLDGDR